MKDTPLSGNSHPTESPVLNTLRGYLPLMGLTAEAASTFLLAHGHDLDDEPDQDNLIQLFLCQAMMSCGIGMGGVQAILGWVRKKSPGNYPPFINILNNEHVSIAGCEECLSIRTFKEAPIPVDIYISTAFDVSLMEDKIELWEKTALSGKGDVK